MPSSNSFNNKYGHIYKENPHDKNVHQLLTFQEDKHIIHPEYTKYQWTPYTYSDNPYYKNRTDDRNVNLYTKFVKPKKQTKDLMMKASTTQSNYIDEIFGINSILKNLGLTKGPLLFFLILWLLLCFHIAFGYTVTLKRLLIAFSLAIASMTMIILLNLILTDIQNYPKEKYFIIPVTLIFFFIGLLRISYIVLTKLIFKNYKNNTYQLYP
jgi:hypothetical protein